VEHLRAAARGEQRQEHLIPHDAPVEAPRIEARRRQRPDVDAGAGQRARQIALVRADARRRADRQLRVERNPQKWNEKFTFSCDCTKL
jgi:hypothetical protein